MKEFKKVNLALVRLNFLAHKEYLLNHHFVKLSFGDYYIPVLYNSEYINTGDRFITTDNNIFTCKSIDDNIIFVYEKEEYVDQKKFKGKIISSFEYFSEDHIKMMLDQTLINNIDLLLEYENNEISLSPYINFTILKKEIIDIETICQKLYEQGKFKKNFNLKEWLISNGYNKEI